MFISVFPGRVERVGKSPRAGVPDWTEKREETAVGVLSFCFLTVRAMWDVTVTVPSTSWWTVCPETVSQNQSHFPEVAVCLVTATRKSSIYPYTCRWRIIKFRFENSWQIWDTGPLSGTWLANIPHSNLCLLSFADCHPCPRVYGSSLLLPCWWPSLPWRQNGIWKPGSGPCHYSFLLGHCCSHDF